MTDNPGRCSAHTPAGAQCKHRATHVTADGRRYCPWHAAQLNTGRPTVHPLARRPKLTWAQGVFANGTPVSDTWHGFFEAGFELGPARISLCGQRYPAIGPRREIKPPFDARDESICYYCRLTLVKDQIKASAGLKPSRT